MGILFGSTSSPNTSYPIPLSRISNQSNGHSSSFHSIISSTLSNKVEAGEINGQVPMFESSLLPLAVSCAPPSPDDITFSTTVLKLEHPGHCTPKKCQLRFSLFLSQSLHMIFTTLAKSSGMGCISISRARAAHAALMDVRDTTVFLQIGQR